MKRLQCIAMYLISDAMLFYFKWSLTSAHITPHHQPSTKCVFASLFLFYFFFFHFFPLSLILLISVCANACVKTISLINRVLRKTTFFLLCLAWCFILIYEQCGRICCFQLIIIRWIEFLGLNEFLVSGQPSMQWRLNCVCDSSKWMKITMLLLVINCRCIGFRLFVRWTVGKCYERTKTNRKIHSAPQACRLQTENVEYRIRKAHVKQFRIEVVIVR